MLKYLKGIIDLGLYDILSVQILIQLAIIFRFFGW